MKIEGVKPMLTDCILHINNIISCLEVDGVEYLKDDILILFQSFDVHMNRPLLGNHPVRKVVYKSAIDSLRTIKNIVTQISLGVCDIMLKGTTLEQVHFLLQLFSKSSFNLLGRSLMLYNLHFDGLIFGQHNFDLWIMDYLKCCGIPTIMTLISDASFINALSKPTYYILKLMTLNRNRQRAFIESCIIPEWNILQMKAEALDSLCDEYNRLEPQPPFLQNFILSITLWIMDLYVSLGIELGLVCQNQELSIAYWYMDNLMSSSVSCNTLMGKRYSKYVAPKNETTNTNLLRSHDNLGFLKTRQMICRGIMRVRFCTMLNGNHISLDDFSDHFHYNLCIIVILGYESREHYEAIILYLH